MSQNFKITKFENNCKIIICLTTTLNGLIRIPIQFMSSSTQKYRVQGWPITDFFDKLFLWNRPCLVASFSRYQSGIRVLGKSSWKNVKLESFQLEGSKLESFFINCSRGKRSWKEPSEVGKFLLKMKIVASQFHWFFPSKIKIVQLLQSLSNLSCSVQLHPELSNFRPNFPTSFFPISFWNFELKSFQLLVFFQLPFPTTRIPYKKGNLNQGWNSEFLKLGKINTGVWIDSFRILLKS